MNTSYFQIFIFALLSAMVASGFISTNCISFSISSVTRYSAFIRLAEDEDAYILLNPSSSQMDRRKWLANCSVVVTRAANCENANAASESLTVPKSKSVVVLGANGGTGKECASAVRSYICYFVI